MDATVWRILALLALIAAGLYLFRQRGRGSIVCSRCGFATRPGTPACPRCGRDLDMAAVDLGRLEAMRRRGEIGEAEYRRRKLALLRGDGPGDGGERG